jgi:hypothetical protein
LNDVLLRLCPSLPGFRRRLPSLVQLVHVYYGTVRLLLHVHVRYRDEGTGKVETYYVRVWNEGL